MTLNSSTQTAQTKTDKPRQQPKKAGLLRALWVITYSIVVTGKYCLKTLYFAFFSKKNMRSKVDKILFDWSSRLIRAGRLEWEVEGDLEAQVEEGRRVIIMCNHSSAYDIPLAFTALPGSIRMISKKEMFSIPLLSSAMKAAEILSINRQNRQQAIKDLKIAREKMESGIRIWMFPEGTRSKNGEVIPLKKGGIRLAIDTNALIIPVVMQDIYKVLPDKKWLKMRLHQPVKVKVGQAIDCREFDAEHRHELSDLVYNSMKRMLEERSS